MMEEMMKACCGEEGMPDFDKMKAFMETCGKQDLSADEVAMMKEFCGREGMPNRDEMMKLMEKCGCRIPETTA